MSVSPTTPETALAGAEPESLSTAGAMAETAATSRTSRSTRPGSGS